MLNKYPLWKYLIILAMLTIGLIYAIPNLYPQIPAIQISSERAGANVPTNILEQATHALSDANIMYESSELLATTAQIQFADNERQLKAKTVIQKTLGDDYVVALNLAPTTPDWLTNIGANPMKLGLDLRGGVHFLMEVDMAFAITKELTSYSKEIMTFLRENKLQFRKVSVEENNQLHLKFSDQAIQEQSASLLKKKYDVFDMGTNEIDNAYYLTLTLNELRLKDIEDRAIEQNLITLRNRVNEMGVSEPMVQRQGRNRIVVELPGVQDTAEAKRRLGKTANLEIRLEANNNTPASRIETFKHRNPLRPPARLEKRIVITGEHVSNAQPNFDESGQPIVMITLDSDGGKKLYKATVNNVNRNMGILLVEQKTRTKYITNEQGEEIIQRSKYETKEVISLATIRSALGSIFQIEGIGSIAEVKELALLLRSGAFAAPMFIVEERTIGPSLGQQNIDIGVLAIEIGFLAVLLFMLFYYRIFGLFANVALTINLVLITAAMSLFGAVLTLPGIAGIVLTVGMAVDANVLIFSRIREEIKNGLTPQSAIQAGYDRAFVTILDANITTLLVALILFAIGTGPIKGFAVTLSIGILTSMFTAIMGTRALANLYYGGRKVKKLAI